MPLRRGLATRNDLEMSQALENACKHPGHPRKSKRKERERFSNFTRMRSCVRDMEKLSESAGREERDDVRA
jgi:hypothetical protein